jgi:transcriptional regulator with XRE-family HTH domain
MSAVWFGEKLRELRKARGMTQQQLAKAVGVKWEAISRWERGVREPGWSNVLALASALTVDCTAFQDPPAPPEKRTPAPKKGRKGQ